METVYIRQDIQKLKNKVGQLRQIVSLIINVLQRYEGGTEILEKIQELEKEGN